MTKPVVLDGSPLTFEQVETVARSHAPVEIGAAAAEKLREGRRLVEMAIAGKGVHYGINTGFGALSRVRVSAQQLREVQRNLVRSHSAGAGEPVPEDVVRGMMLVLAASLCRGLSGVRPVVVERLVAMLNAGIHPIVPSIGSVGASGDLAPLAHIALVLIGEGEAQVRGRRVSATEALAGAGIEPVALEAKEGLALLNGTHLMAARAALICCDVERVLDAALAGAAMSIDGCRATDRFLDARVYGARNHPGPAEAARRMAGLLAGSQIVPSHQEHDPRVQDPYSLRCAPLVLGAAMDAIGYVKQAVANELGAVTDNPLVFGGSGGDPDIVSAGNFHGMPLAIPLDALAIALAHVAGIAERRVYYILGASDPQNPLNPALSPAPGVHSGLMLVQYTAAACCNELAGLAAPASVHNLPTSAGMEDYNSFGPRAAAKAARAVELTRYVVSIELLCAAEALEYQRPLRSGAGVEHAYTLVRGVVGKLTEDRPPAPDIERISARVAAGAFRGLIPADGPCAR